MKNLQPELLALRLTLLELLLRPIALGPLRFSIQAFSVLGLASPRLMQRWQFWALLTGLATTRVLADWPMADNHAYLISYWLLAVTLSRVRNADPALLAHNARLLIGLTFAFATLWKVVLSPDYLDGTFFRFTLATDDRLQRFAVWATGMSREQLAALGEHLRAGGQLGTTLENERYVLVAKLSALWNAVINAALASAFLLPRVREWLRHGLLLVYCMVTYAVATVDGFAWLLLAMGAARVSPSAPYTAGAYVAVFLLVVGYRELL